MLGGKIMRIIMGENLIYDATVQVGSHHYARLFSKENDVLWISLPWNIFLYFKYGKQGERYRQWNRGKIYEKDGIKIWCPFTFVPYRDNLPFKSIKNIKRTLKYTFPNLKRRLTESGYDSCDVLWITDPRMMYLCDIIQYKKLVYRCVDDLSHFKGIPANIQEAEKQLIQKADIVFATAETLKTRIEGYGKTVYSLQNAVDYNFFHSYNILEKSCRIDHLENIILYVGTIGEWFDCEFVKYCATKRQEYQFVIIGPQRTDISILTGISNIHILGSVAYKDVPMYMKKSNIGIIPFKFNQLVDAVNPLKLYEYFACGLPVVATAAYELRKMNSPACLYNSYDEAISFFDDLLEGKYKADEINKFAKNNSWESRYQYIMRLLNE